MSGAPDGRGTPGGRAIQPKVSWAVGAEAPEPRPEPRGSPRGGKSTGIMLREVWKRRASLKELPKRLLMQQPRPAASAVQSSSVLTDCSTSF